MKRVKINATVLDTIDFGDEVSEKEIDDYMNSYIYHMQSSLDKSKYSLGIVTDIEYGIQSIEDYNGD